MKYTVTLWPTALSPAAVAILASRTGGENIKKTGAFKTLVRAFAVVAAVLGGCIALWRALADAGRRATVRRLMEDHAILEAVEEHSREHGMAFAESLRVAGDYSREISPSRNPRFYLRVGVPLSRLIARSLYGDRLRSEGSENIPATNEDSGVIFVINHRSNLDYVILGHLLDGRATPSFAAGEWALFWPLGPLVRAMGSFFVRRGSGDALYRRVLERYVQTGLERGLTPAIFIEGGLSRDGRLREPKTGLLDYALRGFDPSGRQDLLFVPVGINHDWILEDGDLPAPGAPNPSGVKAVFSTVLFISGGLRGAFKEPDRLGHAAVSFGESVSAREWTKLRGVDFRELDTDARIGLVREFAGDIMGRIGSIMPVTPVPVVAHAILELPEGTFSAKELLSRSRETMFALGRRGSWICFEGDALESTLGMLVARGLVIQNKNGYLAAPDGGKLLRFYAASISHLLPEGTESGG